MDELMVFSTREEFRSWLQANCRTSGGIWLRLGKPGGPKTLKAGEALEEALCFGWIDGQMQSLDETSYKKYFSQRRKNSKWSEKNKALALQLAEQNKMAAEGLAKMEEARENGQWDSPKNPPVTEEDMERLAEILGEYEPACSNFLAMSSSVKKTYARAYLDAKTDKGRASRLSWMVERLNQNLKPM